MAEKLIVRVEKHFFAFVRWCQFLQARYNSKRVKTLEEFRGQNCKGNSAEIQRYMHSEGLREIADIVVDFGSDNRPKERKALLPSALKVFAAEIPTFSIVYIFTDHLDYFVEEIFPLLKRPIVLVTGGSDISPVKKHFNILYSPLIAHWFVENNDSFDFSAKLTLIPIGLCNPISNNLERRIWFFIDQLEGKIPFDPTFKFNPKGNQNKLREISDQLPPMHCRPKKVLCTFYVWPPESHKNTTERSEAYEMQKDNPFCHFSKRLAQYECWNIHRDFAFEISPHGYGLDCFRTWEALALKTIPIVKTSPLDRLYLENDLPVVIVQNWSDITPENLEIWKSNLAEKFNASLDHKLSNDYWTEKIKAKKIELATAIPQA